MPLGHCARGSAGRWVDKNGLSRQSFFDPNNSGMALSAIWSLFWNANCVSKVWISCYSRSYDFWLGASLSFVFMLLNRFLRILRIGVTTDVEILRIK